MTDGAGPGAGPWLVVGLGNPGAEYARNRHNAGFLVADLLARRVGAKFGRARRAATEVAEGFLRPGGPKVVIAKPTTYMNLLGTPTTSLAAFYKIPPARIVAVHDDLDLDFGTVRAKIGGGEGGHNGLRSMSKSLGTKDYARVRFGIGRPPGRMDGAAFVLGNFTTPEWREVPTICEQAADAAELLVTQGLEPAQNTVHAWG